MISKYFAKAQIIRLSGLSFYPSIGAALNELVLALQCADASAPDPTLGEQIAKEVIDGFLETETECPKPADIRRAVHEHTPEDEPDWISEPKPQFDCACRGWGLIGERFKKTYCSCPVGQSLRHVVTSCRVKPYEGTRYTPETWLAMVNAAPLTRPGETGGLRQVHPSWLEAGSRVRMGSPRIGRSRQ